MANGKRDENHGRAEVKGPNVLEQTIKTLRPPLCSYFSLISYTLKMYVQTKTNTIALHALVQTALLDSHYF